MSKSTTADVGLSVSLVARPQQKASENSVHRRSIHYNSKPVITNQLITIDRSADQTIIVNQHKQTALPQLVKCTEEEPPRSAKWGAPSSTFTTQPGRGSLLVKIQAKIFQPTRLV